MSRKCEYYFILSTLSLAFWLKMRLFDAHIVSHCITTLEEQRRTS
ncbi:MAG: hypothetical protein ACFC03_02240 [Candidatus Malihini olakiniferum]